MKRLIYFPMALAALMLGACSSNEDVVDGGNSSNDSGTDGYISVNINLPSTPAVTKADDQGTSFDNGDASEYAVKSAYLLLFSGENEASATCHSITPLNTNWNGVDDNPNQITTSSTITTKVSVPTKSTSAPNLYAYVILNPGTLLTENASKLCNTTIVGAKFSDLQKLDMGNGNKIDAITTTGFLMGNAPLSLTAGGTSSDAPKGETQVLSSVAWDKIYATEALAKSNDPATEVYVERAMAKVTVNPVTETDGKKIDGTDITYSTVKWGLDITNKKSYFGRLTDDFSTWAGIQNSSASSVKNEYRFVGLNKVEAGKELYRTYWAKDPNYSADNYTGTAFAYASDFASNFNSLANGDGGLVINADFDQPKYCFENTFDVDDQNQNQTTRVVVALKIGSSNGFYTINGEKKIYTKDQVIEAFKGAVTGDPTVKEWVTDNFTLTSGSGDIGAANIEITLSDDNPQVGTKGITVTSYKLTGVTVKEGSSAKAEDITTKLSVADLNTKVGEVNYYAGGIAYYPIRIKHFGDLQTPWDAGEATVAAGQGYPTEGFASGNTRDGSYLGRYGVLRNNWYDISVKEVLNIGSPVVPEIPTENTPDDVKESYIKCKINVLSWAKRTQSATLQ